MKNLIFVIVFVILVGSGCKNFRKSSAGNVDTLFADTAMTEAEPVDSAALFEAMESYRVTSEAPQQVTAPVRNPAANEGGNNYFMIVGCFTIPRNAELYAAKVRDLGYNATIIQGHDNFQMVAARSYNNYQESISEIEKFRNEISPEAWVYVRR